MTTNNLQNTNVYQLEKEINTLILNSEKNPYKYDAFLPEDEVLKKINQIHLLDASFEFSLSTKQALREWMYWTYHLEQEQSSCKFAYPLSAYTHHKEIYQKANLGTFEHNLILALLPQNYYLKTN